MSHAATNWAISQRGLKPATKIVLWHLADCHNGHTGQCNPKQSTLAEKCEMSRSTVNVHLDLLEKTGLIRRVSDTDPETKRKRPTHYILALDDRGESVSGNKTQAQDVDCEAQDVVSPCPESGQVAVSGFRQKPCPDFGQSHVRNPDIKNLGKEPGREPVSTSGSPHEILCQIIPADLATEFIGHRQELRKPLTARSASMLVKKFTAHPNPASEFERSIANGWQGVFESKQQSEGGKNASRAQKWFDACMSAR